MNRRQFGQAVGALAGSHILNVAGSQAWAQSNEPIRIGLIASLSGPQAQFGAMIQVGAEIAIDQVNQAGGVLGRKVEMIIRDDKASPAEATTAARELMGQGVKLIFGCNTSPIALALSPLVAQEGGILLTVAAHSERLTHDNFVRNYFRVGDNPYMRCTALGNYTASKFPDIQNWGSVIPDHDYGNTTYKCFREGILEFYPKVANKTPTVEEPIRTAFGGADYRAAISRAVSMPIDGLMVAAYGGDGITFYKQAAPYGLLQKVKAILDPANELLVAKAMTRDTPEMIVSGNWYPATFESVEVSRQLYAELVKRTGEKIIGTGHPSESHAAIMAFVSAIKATGNTETDALIGALEDITFDTATGPRTFRKEDHQAIKPVSVVHLRGSAEAPEGIEIIEAINVPAEDIIEPATPGQPMPYKHG